MRRISESSSEKVRFIVLSRPDDLRHAPSDQHEDGEHEPVVLIAVGGDGEVIADHDENDRQDDEGVLLGALFGEVGQAHVRLACRP